jgi:hypothetical protein
VPETNEKKHQEKKLQSGKTVINQLESGKALTWRNNWIEDQA